MLVCLFVFKSLSIPWESTPLFQQYNTKLTMSNAEMLIHAFMTSRFDYCNALLGGCSARLINKLQKVQNAAARVLTRTRKYDHISPVMSLAHYWPLYTFQILLITNKALNGLASQYLSELLSHSISPRPLRSQNSGHLIIPRISKSTAYLAPKLWNNLPTVRESDTLYQSLRPISLTWLTHNTLKHL